VPFCVLQLATSCHATATLHCRDRPTVLVLLRQSGLQFAGRRKVASLRKYAYYHNPFPRIYIHHLSAWCASRCSSSYQQTKLLAYVETLYASARACWRYECSESSPGNSRCIFDLHSATPHSFTPSFKGYFNSKMCILLRNGIHGFDLRHGGMTLLGQGHVSHPDFSRAPLSSICLYFVHHTYLKCQSRACK
jgi:hypothetical protein